MSRFGADKILYKSQQNIFGASRSYTVVLFGILTVTAVIMPVAALLGVYLPA